MASPLIYFIKNRLIERRLFSPKKINVPKQRLIFAK